MEIKKILADITEAFKQLVKANEMFSNNEPGIESFQALVNQRELIIEDIENLTHELIKEINHIYRDNSFACKNLSETIRALVVLAPELSEKCNALKACLSELVESDKLIEKKLLDLKDSVKLELNKIRKGSKILKGYKQANPMDSCFIDKTK